MSIKVIAHRLHHISPKWDIEYAVIEIDGDTTVSCYYATFEEWNNRIHPEKISEGFVFAGIEGNSDCLGHIIGDEAKAEFLVGKIDLAFSYM